MKRRAIVTQLKVLRAQIVNILGILNNLVIEIEGGESPCQEKANK